MHPSHQSYIGQQKSGKTILLRSTRSACRWIGTHPEGVYNLHFFCDASEVAYGCCVYVSCHGRRIPLTVLESQGSTSEINIACQAWNASRIIGQQVSRICYSAAENPNCSSQCLDRQHRCLVLVTKAIALLENVGSQSGFVHTVKLQIFVRYLFSYFWLETGSYELIFVRLRASQQNHIEIRGSQNNKNFRTVLNLVID